MSFPETPRIVYKKNQLNKVVCQVRFPPILRIESEVPSLFQESIRQEYPFYSKKEMAFQMQVDSQKPAINIPNQMLFKRPINTTHEFTSQDRIWVLNLTSNALSLTTSKYPDWEGFSDKFRKIFSCFNTQYTPPFYTRLGLKYIDIFDRHNLGLIGVPWKELIQPHFLGLHSTSIGQDILSCECKYIIKLSEKESIVRISTNFVQNILTEDDCFMVDSDFSYSKNCPIDQINSTLDYFHTEATKLIQFIVTKKLNDAMEPTNK
jgi:uncharacterized protein (TIGR04255 family)